MSRVGQFAQRRLMGPTPQAGYDDPSINWRDTYNGLIGPPRQQAFPMSKSDIGDGALGFVGNGLISSVYGLGGLGLAPFTGGTSLSLGVPAAAYGYKAYNDYNKMTDGIGANYAYNNEFGPSQGAIKPASLKLQLGEYDR